MKKTGDRVREIATQRAAIARFDKEVNEEERYRERFTPEYFLLSGKRILELAEQMERHCGQLAEISDYEREMLLWSDWKAMRDYLDELTYGIELLPNINETGFREWRITDALLPLQYAIRENDDDKLREAIDNIKTIGHAIDTAMQNASPHLLVANP